MKASATACLVFGAWAAWSAMRPIDLPAQTGAAVTTVRLGASGGVSSMAAVVDAVKAADVLVIGERHDSRASHVFELELLRSIAKVRPKVSLALEMFERDVDEPLAHFGMGHVSEQELLAAARPWPQYTRDYKPLVDFAVERGWTLVAGNVPRSLAADVARAGLGVLEKRPEADRAWFARDIQCPTNDAYFSRFQATIHAQPEILQTPGTAAAAPAPAATADRASVERYYFAQCLKDETMAESIASSHAAGSIGGGKPLVISVVGSFHSDFGDGIVSRTRRRMPKARIVTLSLVPGTSAAPATAATAKGRAEFVVFVGGR